MIDLTKFSFQQIIDETHKMKNELPNLENSTNQYQKYTYFVFGFGALLLIYKYFIK